MGGVILLKYPAQRALIRMTLGAMADGGGRADSVSDVDEDVGDNWEEIDEEVR